jgi:hypothetical protein
MMLNPCYGVAFLSTQPVDKFEDNLWHYTVYRPPIIKVKNKTDYKYLINIIKINYLSTYHAI